MAIQDSCTLAVLRAVNLMVEQAWPRVVGMIQPILAQRPYGQGQGQDTATTQTMADLGVLMAWLVGSLVVLVVAAFLLRKWLLGGGMDALTGGSNFSLNELRTLRDRGMMDDTEFDRAKTRLIAESRHEAAMAETPPTSDAPESSADTHAAPPPPDSPDSPDSPPDIPRNGPPE